MEMQLLPWIKDDVAIEIIGKMIGEQVSLLSKHVAPLLETGIHPSDARIVDDPMYKEYMQRIIAYKQEINQIYKGKNLEVIYRKVDEEYVPHLNEQYTQVETQSGDVKFFDESKGFGFVKPVDSDRSMFVNASDLNQRFSEDKPAKPESIREANEHH